MNNPLRQLEDAVYAAVDAAVLWAWDEFGIPYRTLCDVALTITFATSAARNCKWGTHFDLGFWIFAAIIGFLASLMSLPPRIYSAEMLTAMNLAQRHGWMSRLTNFIPVTSLLDDLYRGDHRGAVTDATMLATWLLLGAAVPTKPRRPREVHNPFLTWAPARI